MVKKRVSIDGRVRQDGSPDSPLQYCILYVGMYTDQYRELVTADLVH